MRRVLVALLIGALTGVALPSAADAFSLTKWEAGTCSNEECTDAGPHEDFYTQAAGHPNFGITDFRFASTKTVVVPGVEEWEEPVGHVKDVRVDLPAGLAVNPEATPQCEEAQLNKDEKLCPPKSQVGVDEATGTAEVLGIKKTVTEDFPVYNMRRRPGEPALFGVEVNSALVELAHAQGHIYLEGGISWQPAVGSPKGGGSEDAGVEQGDYHEYFEIHEIPTVPELIESRLIFWGVPQEMQSGSTEAPKAFITLPSTCTSPQRTWLHVDSYEEPGHYLEAENMTPVTATGCSALAFDPSLSLVPETSQSDEPDGASATLHVPQLTSEPSKPNSPDVQGAEVTLPAGMTLNPSAANGLQACSDAQYVQDACPAASQVGTVSANAPGIPEGSLAGGVYVGAAEPGQGPESGGMYRLFVLAETARQPGAEGPGGVYGVGLRLEGRVSANPQTGQLTATFANAPQVPFEQLTLHFNGGPRAPLANPLPCEAVKPSGSILPYGGAAKAASSSGFTISGCASPLPFSLTQGLAAKSTQAGAFGSFTFDLARADGQQYVSHLTTTLPAGLVGAIPTVPLCGEAQANAGSCPATSQIGTVAVSAGAGGEPYAFTGQAFLTGPYEHDPYGLSVVVLAIAGPYDLGDVVTRAGISVGMYNARVSVSSTLPTIVGGVPLRLKSLTVDVDRANFASNPTSCSAESDESVFGSTLGASDSLSSSFQASGCPALAFKPSLSLKTSAKASKPNGASFVVQVTQGAHQAGIRELQLQLPKQLVARFSTIQTSCPAAKFETGPPPGTCEAGARVGTVSVSTPVLPGRLTGTAWFVSHGNESFPDLDLVLNGDGVEVVLVGHTHIARSSITTSTFEELPDVPISNVTVDLPLGPSSALSANGPLCGANLLAPTTLIGQNGAKISQQTSIAVTGCAIRVISHRLRGRHLRLTLWAPEAGRVRVSAPGMRTVTLRVRKAGRVTLKLHLSAIAMVALHGHRHKLKLRIGFTPKTGHNSSVARLALR
ncbi:MAG TPA: hypothetical protein VK765_07025 [Solirubrobacteraceae bacterium]|jgi:hypothetical protein|nr:hypothetical protein [Solirubrobacteraceae bacterium]